MSSIESVTFTNTSFESESVEYSAENDYQTRFNNVGKLYGSKLALQRLKEAKVCIIGLGGVGSWVVEALARSGICQITLFDMDDICVSNINRQIMATTDTVGQFKADALKTRISSINPLANVSVYYDFIRPDNVLTHLTHATNLTITRKFDFIIDAADSVSDKSAIINACVLSNTPIVASGGVGGLTDPTLVTISDLTEVIGDNLLMRVRKRLRQDYAYPKGDRGSKIKKWNVPAVHTKPTGRKRVLPLTTSDSDNFDSKTCTTDTVDSTSFRKCDGAMGNACFATGTVGFIMASVVINAIATNTCITPRNPNFMSVKKEKSGMAEQDMISGDGNEQNCNCGSADFSLIQTNTNTPQQESSSNGLNSSGSESSVEKLVTMFGDRNEVALDVPIIDAHCHLQLSKIYQNRSTILNHATKIANISHMVVCGTTPLDNDWERVKELATQNLGRVIPSFGLHPWFVERFLQRQSELDCSWQEALERKLQEYPNAGVGECGLDKNVKKDAPMEIQTEVLREHIRIAAKYNRSLTIHCVAGSWRTLLEILREECHAAEGKVSLPRSIILHSCNGLPLDMLDSFRAIPGLFFSVSGRGLHERCLPLLIHLPLDQLLIETDSPDQVPLPLKHQFDYNEPSLLRWTLREVAKVREMDVAELARITAANTKRAYCIP